MLNGEDTILQLYGSSNTEFINASQVIFEQLPQLKGIDVNLGCPAQCAQKENYGFFFKDDYISLLSKLKHIYPNKIVSAKIRLCPTLEASINKIQKILDTGLDILTIHCRKEPLANDESQKEQPDYQMLYDVLNIIKPSSQTKIIVNGGLKQFSQSLKQHSDYIHGEMIGVGFMGNPKLCQVEVKSSGKILLHYYLGQNELNMLIEFNKTFLNNSDYNSMQHYIFLVPRLDSLIQLFSNFSQLTFFQLELYFAIQINNQNGECLSICQYMNVIVLEINRTAQLQVINIYPKLQTANSSDTQSNTK
ncbi:TRNA_dihydrouridine synthase [Hexamita inflata]|uniref:tRNA dihydrouridine synthase n=1 Tax=Hexamita inflata TaxID=28002 RepID=A0AA86ULW0_9EUKA|nr:TRNA dihydrouridine synthase [Hexamita inflata]